MDYTDSQRDAIGTIDKNLQIIACAGSGKTQVISERIVGILKNEPGVTAANIVAFTFTGKAAGELKDRIHRLCREQLGTDRGLAETFVGTIHAFCLDLLQSPPLYRYLKYTVLSDVQQRLLIDRYSLQSGLCHVPLLAGGLLERWLRRFTVVPIAVEYLHRRQYRSCPGSGRRENRDRGIPCAHAFQALSRLRDDHLGGSERDPY